MGVKSVFFLLFAFLFYSCGLDTFYNLEPPVTRNTYPAYNTADPTQRRFDFNTNDTVNKTLLAFTYLGTAVYYRIYSDSNTMRSRNAAIDSVNNASNYNAAAERLISYGYKELQLDTGSQSPLVPPSASNSRRVQIRLTDFNEVNAPSKDPDLSPYVRIDGVHEGLPRREEGRYTFDFGRSEDDRNSVRPSSGDSDFESGSFTDGGKYYVDMYAVAVGRDTTYTTYYSTVLHLGAVPVDAAVKIN